MKTLTIRKAREALGHMDRLVAEHGEIVLTRHGRPIVRVVPVESNRVMPSRRALRESLETMERGSEELIREERDQR